MIFKGQIHSVLESKGENTLKGFLSYCSRGGAENQESRPMESHLVERHEKQFFFLNKKLKVALTILTVPTCQK